MGKWGWLLIGVGVVYYLSKREEASTKIAANRQATGAINHAGSAVNNLIDQGASALGRFISGIGRGSSSSSSGGSSSGYGTYVGPDDDPSVYVPEFDYGD
jgi:hypothetical protein